MREQIDDRTIALAAIIQSAALVKKIAIHGYVEENYFRTCIASIFKIDSNSTEEIYGGVKNLKIGFEETINMLKNPNSPKDRDIARYTLSLIHLERKLQKDNLKLEKISSGIIRAQKQSEIFSVLHENTMANIASIYVDTISKFAFRINIAGKPIYINNSYNMNKMRALLLAGIRASVLWHQLGGRRWQLLFSKNKIITSAKQLLKETELEIA